MKNKRKEAKQRTFEKIIQSAKSLIVRNGIIHLKTLDVANDAQIAHGTLFSHFDRKEALVSEICQIELLQIAKKLKSIAEKEADIDRILESYLTLIAENEGFFVVIAKEFPFLENKIQQSILSNETILKNILYQKIELGNNTGQFNVVDITITISFFFASVNYYLARKEYFVTGKGKLMNQKKNQIIETFLKLLN